MKTQHIKAEATEQDLTIRFINAEASPFSTRTSDESLFKVYEASLNWRVIFHYDSNGIDNTVFEIDSFTATIVREEFSSLIDLSDGYEHPEEEKTFNFTAWEIIGMGKDDKIQVDTVIIDFANKTLSFESYE